MEIGTHSALLVFYAIFWGVALNSSNRYRPFDTAAMFSFHGTYAKKAWLRFLLALVVFILLPLLSLWFSWTFLPNGIFEKNFSEVMIAALSAYSLFGLVRIYNAIVASDKLWQTYYERGEWTRLIAKWLDCNSPNLDCDSPNKEKLQGIIVEDLIYVNYCGNDLEFVNKEPPGSNNCFMQHFFPGISYFVGFPFIAWAIFKLMT